MSEIASRRRLLKRCGLFLTGIMAGCTRSTNSGNRFKVCSLEVQNEDDSAHEIQVSISSSGEQLIKKKVTLPKANGDVVSDENINISSIDSQSFQHLSLTGKVDNASSIEPIELSPNKVDNVTNIIYHVQDDGSLTILYEINSGPECS